MKKILAIGSMLLTVSGCYASRGMERSDSLETINLGELIDLDASRRTTQDKGGGLRFSRSSKSENVRQDKAQSSRRGSLVSDGEDIAYATVQPSASSPVVEKPTTASLSAVDTKGISEIAKKSKRNFNFFARFRKKPTRKFETIEGDVKIVDDRINELEIFLKSKQVSLKETPKDRRLSLEIKTLETEITRLKKERQKLYNEKTGTTTFAQERRNKRLLETERLEKQDRIEVSKVPAAVRARIEASKKPFLVRHYESQGLSEETAIARADRKLEEEKQRIMQEQTMKGYKRKRPTTK